MDNCAFSWVLCSIFSATVEQVQIYTGMSEGCGGEEKM